MVMLLQACGAKYHIDEESLDQTNVDDVVVALVNMAKRVSSTSSCSTLIIIVIFFSFSIYIQLL